MRNRMGFVIVAAFALAIVMTAVLTKNVDSKETADGGAWEYLVVSGGTTNLDSLSSSELGMRKRPDDSFREASVLQRNLDKLGAKGWQLVAVNGSPNNPIYYFKRPKEGN
jgi:hypothetical protein